MNWKTRILPAFSLGCIIRRLIGAWFFSAFLLLLLRAGNYASLNYLKDTNIVFPLLVFIGIFLMISALAVVCSVKRTDSFAMMSGALFASAVWVARVDLETEKEWLFCFTLIGLLAFVVYDFVKQNEDLFSRVKFSSRFALCVAIGCGILMAVMIAVVTCLRYVNFATPTYDFGIFIQMFHNMAETFQPLTTCERNEVLSHFAVHLSPIYYVLLPFYWLFPSPLTLQIGQAVIVASGIIPFYLLMRRYRLSASARTVFCILYFLFPVISKGCFFDLHENCFLFPLLMWIFWAYESEKIPLLALFTVLCCLVKEDSAVYVTIFSLYCLISGENKKKKLMGAGMMAYAVLYFLFAVWYINTFGKGIMSGRFDNVSSDGSLVGVIVTAFANPGFFIQQILAQGWDSVRYIVCLLLPLGFLPLATGKSSRWLLLVPMLLNLLTDYPYQLELIYQYHFGISAFLLLLTIMNWKELEGRARSYLVSLALVASFVLHIYMITPEFAHRVKQYHDNHEVYESIVETLAMVPDDASVNASTFFVTHLAERAEVYEINYHAAVDTDFVVLDMRGAYADASRTYEDKCISYGYGKLVETEYVMIYVSPLWEGDMSTNE